MRACPVGRSGVQGLSVKGKLNSGLCVTETVPLDGCSFAIYVVSRDHFFFSLSLSVFMSIHFGCVCAIALSSYQLLWAVKQIVECRDRQLRTLHLTSLYA